MAATCKKTQIYSRLFIRTAALESYYLQAIYYHRSPLYIMLELKEVDRLVNEQRCETGCKRKDKRKDYRMSLVISFVLKLKEVKGSTGMIYGHVFLYHHYGNI